MFIALTGGIGCGKSRALAEFAKSGFECGDADKICHEFYASEEGISGVRARWPQVFDGDELNRRKLGDIVFRDEAELKVLENLVHPYLERRLAEYRRSVRPVMLEVPLLFEKHLEQKFDVTVAVWSSFAVRRSRLAARGWDARECARRERLQWSADAKLAAAAYGIINQGSEECLAEQCRMIAEKILEKSCHE